MMKLLLEIMMAGTITAILILIGVFVVKIGRNERERENSRD
jgi:hypothetical protein